MAKINSAQELKDYALRQLGQPVINVEIADEQMDDRIDQTIDEFLEYHYNGYDEVPLIYETKKSDELNGYLTLPDNVIGVTHVFSSNDTMTSSEIIDDYQWQVYNEIYWSIWAANGDTGMFDIVSLYSFNEYMGTLESLLDTNVSYTFNAATKILRTHRPLKTYTYTFTVVGDSESPNFIEIDGDETGLARPDRELSFTKDGSDKLYKIDSSEYFESGDVTRIYTTESMTIPTESPLEVFIHTGNMVAMTCYAEVDRNKHGSIFDELWVREMVVARFQNQWANNLRKYKGVKLPGGVEFDVQGMMQESKEEMKRLKEELDTKYSEPPEPFIG